MTSPLAVQLVVDSDCGSDDAMALMLALGGPRAALVRAVTCCYGNTTVRQVRDNVGRVLAVCGRTEIPVYVGSSHPLERAEPDPLAVSSSVVVHGADGFGECSHLFPTGAVDSEEEEGAVDFLLRCARERPGETTLVALGPLTNVAAAHRRDPGSFTRGLREIVILGGNYTGLGNVTPSAEFNFFSDPEAAHVVLTEAHCPIRMVPWETCLHNGMDWEDFDVMLKSPGPKAELIRGATSIVSKFCKEEGDPTFLDCDVLAMVAALWPECVAETKWLNGKMGVVCEENRRGMCFIEEPKRPDGKIGVACEENRRDKCVAEEGLDDLSKSKGLIGDKSVACEANRRDFKDTEDVDGERGGTRVQLILKFHADMLKELRKHMIAEPHRQ